MLALRSAHLLLIVLFVAVHIIGGVSAEDRTEHEYHNDPMTYLVFSFVMTFATASTLMGGFGFKFGKKRTRRYSVPMIAVGVLIWGTWIYFNVIARAEYPHDTILLGVIHWVAAPLLKPLMALLGAAIGFGLSLIIFLNSIVRP